jgi:hypothetical protein
VISVGLAEGLRVAADAEPGDRVGDTGLIVGKSVVSDIGLGLGVGICEVGAIGLAVGLGVVGDTRGSTLG